MNDFDSRLGFFVDGLPYTLQQKNRFYLVHPNQVVWIYYNNMWQQIEQYVVRTNYPSVKKAYIIDMRKCEPDLWDLFQVDLTTDLFYFFEETEEYRVNGKKVIGNVRKLAGDWLAAVVKKKYFTIENTKYSFVYYTMLYNKYELFDRSKTSIIRPKIIDTAEYYQEFTPLNNDFDHRY